MSNVIDIGSLSHRSRERVRNLGEVFTPEAYVESMLSLLDKKVWADESVIFFEPTCGHGNIVLAIYKRRLESLCEKALKLNYKNPFLFAVANAINSLWAIDVDSKNIENCKTRILIYTFEFLKSKIKNQTEQTLVQRNKEFFSHLFCALNWQIHENEALSGLSEESGAMSKANLTKIGNKWFRSNGHKELDFDTPWSFYYSESLRDKIMPMEYTRSQKFTSGIFEGETRGYKEFSFAFFLINKEKFSLEV